MTRPRVPLPDGWDWWDATFAVILTVAGTPIAYLLIVGR